MSFVDVIAIRVRYLKLIIYVITIVFRFGHVFMAETGTSVGEISGQSKSINSCDFRPARPFRLITGSEDNTIAVFEGPPFKFKYVHTYSDTPPFR